MKFYLPFIVLLFTSVCSRSFIVTQDDPYYDLRIKRMNSIGSDTECSVSFSDGRNFETGYFHIANDSIRLVKKGEPDTLAAPFKDVTSIYYIDHWDGLIQGGIFGGAIGFPVGYILLPDWRDFNGTVQHTPETGGCCIGGIGIIVGSIAGVSYGTLKAYELGQDSIGQKDTLATWNER